jgi:transposase
MAKKMMSVLEDLRREMSESKKRVEECEANVARVREEAKKKMEKACMAAELELARAKKANDELVSRIAAELGLPDPAARERKRVEKLRHNKLRKKVAELLEEGKDEHAIHAELGLDRTAEQLDLVRSLISEVKAGDAAESEGGKPPRLPPEAGQRGWKRERVRVLHLEGKSRVEIADELDISKMSVNAHINALVRTGRLSSGEPPKVPAEPAKKVELARKSGEGADDSVEGDSLQDLRDEAARQQGGNRSKAVRLATTMHSDEDADHDHAAVVDRMGDGVTVPDDTEHQHKVYRFVVGGAAGHRHGLLAEEAPAD